MHDAFRRGSRYAIIGALFYGSVGIFVREAASGLGPITQSFGRIFFSFIFISIYLLIKKPSLIKIPRSAFPWLATIAVIGTTLQAMAFTEAVNKTSIANAYFLLYTSPIFVFIFGYLFLKERINRASLVVLLISMVGVVLMFNPSDLSKNFMGNLYGAATGVTFAIYLLLIKHTIKKLKPETIAFWTLALGIPGLFLASIIFERNSITAPTLDGVGWTALAGAVIVAGTILLNKGLSLLPAWQSSILSLFEAVGAVIYSYIVFSESPGVWTILGALTIIYATVLLAQNQKRHKIY